MKFSEFKKLSYEKMNWSMVINEFNPCPKCGSKVDIKDDWEHGYWGDAQDGYADHYRNWWHKPYNYKHFYFDHLSDWDKHGLQYYICKKCNNKIQTEKSKARRLEIDAGTEVYWNKPENDGETKLEMIKEKEDYERKLRWAAANASLMTNLNGKRYIEMFQEQWPIKIKIGICLDEINEIEAMDPLLSKLQKIFSDIKHGETYSRKPNKRPMLITNIWPSYPDRDEIVEMEKRGYVKILRHDTRVRTDIDSVDDIVPDLIECKIERWKFLKKTYNDLRNRDVMFTTLEDILLCMIPNCSSATPFSRMKALEASKRNFKDNHSADLSSFIDVDELDARIIELKKESDEFHEIWNAREAAVEEDNAREEVRERAEYLRLHPRQITLFEKIVVDT